VNEEILKEKENERIKTEIKNLGGIETKESEEKYRCQHH
jgi:hypothetical protein